MPPRHKARLVPLAEEFAAQHPGRYDLAALVARGDVLVEGRPVSSTGARVRAGATVALRRESALRGTAKLRVALTAFAVDAGGRVALDAGAAAGGFTVALLDVGVRRVYAVDVGHGQLRGDLRQDPRVVVLERTNIADLSPALIPDAVDLVTLDLSYLSLADAAPQLECLRFAAGAELVALVKPMFELGLGSLPTDPGGPAEAAARASAAINEGNWLVDGHVESPVTGAHGARELFLHAARR